MRRWAGLVGCTIAWLLVAALALGALGLFVPAIPYIGVAGGALLGPFGAWMPLVLAIIAAWWLRRGIAQANRPALTMGIIAWFGVLGYAVALWQIVAAARAEGVHVDFVKMLTFRHGGGVDGTPRSFVYGRFHDADQHALVYPTIAHAAPLPILVYIHGGGWVSGDETMRSGDMRQFAARGALPIALGYALSNDRLHLWDRTEDELGCALAWINQHAARLGGDPARLVLIGDSAGGNLVLDLAYRANAGRLRSACGGALPRVAAVAATYPVIDPASFHDNPDIALGGAARRMSSQYTGGTPVQFPTRYQTVTSASWINPAAPPTLLVVPIHDHLVPIGPTYAFARQATAAGIAVRVVSVPYGEHAFDFMPGSAGDQLLLATTNALLHQTVLKPTH